MPLKNLKITHADGFFSATPGFYLADKGRKDVPRGFSSAPASLHYVKGTYELLFFPGALVGALRPVAIPPRPLPSLPPPRARRQLHAAPPLHCHGPALPRRRAGPTTWRWSSEGRGGNDRREGSSHASDGRCPALMGTRHSDDRVPSPRQESAAYQRQDQHARYLHVDLLVRLSVGSSISGSVASIR